MKIGIFTVSIPEYEPERALEVASAIGYDGLEWRICKDAGDRAKPSFWCGNRTSMTPAELLAKAEPLKELARKVGMEMPSLAAYISCFDLEEAEATFRAANAVGAHSIRVNPAGYQPDLPYWKQFADSRDQYAKIEQLAKRYQVRALMETHMGLLTPNVALAVRMLDGMDPAHVGIIWDPGNQVEEGLERYPMAISMAGEYLGEVHVKNRLQRPYAVENDTLHWFTENVPVRLGSVNWPAVIAELKKASYDGWLMFEDFSTIQPVADRMKDNLKYLQAILG